MRKREARVSGSTFGVILLIRVLEKERERDKTLTVYSASTTVYLHHLLQKQNQLNEEPNPRIEKRLQEGRVTNDRICSTERMKGVLL